MAIKSKFTSFKKIIQASTTVVCIAFMTGCANNSQQRDPKNYINDIQQEQMDVTLWTGRYIGTENNCFPPIDKRLCRRIDLPIYAEGIKLDMEIFKYSLKIGNNGIDSDAANELMKLRAAQTAVKRGYKYITPLQSRLFINCSRDNKTTTTGQFLGNYFSGVSRTSQTSNCSGATDQEFLMFNEPNDLAQGVFIKNMSGQFASENIGALISLYYGSIPNLPLPKEVSTGSIFNGQNYPYQSWKNFLAAENVIQNITGKY